MGILDIRPVVRHNGRVLIAIAGLTGDGKTRTALEIARGMVNHPSKIGLLDTEHGRGSFHSDVLDGKFQIADLFPPHSPARYSEAIREFRAVGVEVLIMDSGSHEWEGEGGCEDIANAKMGTSDAPNWILAKKEHKRFMNTLLHTDMHIIICLRAREKSDFKNPKKPVSLGVQPICEKNFMFEMTVSLMVENGGKTQRFIKMPDFLRPAFGDGKDYLGQQAGRKIIEWVNAGEPEDPEIKRIKAEMLIACEGGVEAVNSIWKSLTPAQKKKLETHKNICKEAAEEYKRQEADGGETPRQGLVRKLAAAGGKSKVDMP